MFCRLTDQMQVGVVAFLLGKSRDASQKVHLRFGDPFATNSLAVLCQLPAGHDFAGRFPQQATGKLNHTVLAEELARPVSRFKDSIGKNRPATSRLPLPNLSKG
jgi:hypothetical protein